MNELPIFSDEYKKIAIPILKKILEKGTKLIDELKGDLIILGQDLTFLCPENCEKWSIIFRTRKGILGTKKSFPLPSVRKVTVNSIIPPKDVTSKCVNLLQGGFELHYKNLEDDTLYVLNTEFDIETSTFIDHLVYKKVQQDALHEYRRYWMQAQLKFIDVLEKSFSDIRFEDINLNVQVSTHEDIRTTVPIRFKEELEVVLKWMKTTDREQKHRLSMEHLKLLRARRGGSIKHGKSILELLQELQDIFLPKTFRTFLKVEQDFYYHDCFRGADYYAAPFPTWPKFMTIITRTNLNLNKPAAVGYLDFKYNDFKKKIEELFERFL
ncbi:MAG: hypothetical protein QXE05_00120 [Nitrososphaeria archaeon]